MRHISTLLNLKMKTPNIILKHLISLAFVHCCLDSVAIANPITVENLNPGTRNWNLSINDDAHTATDAIGQIKGYTSATSVNKGRRIDFKISVSPAQDFTIEVYRVGWYGGKGGRLMRTIGPIAGSTQAPCPRNELTGLIECSWSTSYTLKVPSSWTSGIYLAKLKNASGFDSGTIFVVRDDNRIADFLYQQPVTTYQAYNEYPTGVNGKSLYGNVLGESPAVKVSFNRPYGDYQQSTNGYSDFLFWELMLVKWLEKEGYDVAYSTNIDTHLNGNRLLNYRAFISTGHDEYWSKEMRDAVENARGHGVNLAFFGSNAAYWQVRLEPASDGSPNRTMVGYKSSILDPIADPALKTDLFRSPTVNRPEQELLGSQYISYNHLWNLNTYTDLIVKNTSHWVYKGSGLIEGQRIPAIVGYEIDTIYPSPTLLPTNTEFTVLAASPFVDINGDNFIQNSLIYKTPQGGWVFASGTMSWSWALDFESSMAAFGEPYVKNLTNPGLQKITQNIMDRFTCYPRDSRIGWFYFFKKPNC